MFYVALAAIAALVLLALVFAGIVRSLVRQHHRERDLLVNQLCALAGRPWLPAPADDRSFREPVPVEVPELVEPGQWPE